MGILTPQTPSARTDRAKPLHLRFARASFEISRATTLVILLSLSVLCLAVSWVILVVPGKSYIEVWLNDVIGFIDLAYRVHFGQIPYRDFHLMYGPTVAVITALGLSLGLNVGTIFGFQSVVIAALVLLAAAVMMPQRLTLVAAVLVLVLIWLLITVPITDGAGFFDLTWANFYNRQAWAALLVLILFYVEPKCRRPWDKWSDSMIVALLLLFSIYTKFTFGVVAVGFVAANAVTSRYKRDISLIGLLLTALTMLCLEAAFHFHADYWHDIHRTMSTLAEGVWIGGIVSMSIGNAPSIFACFGALVAVRIAGRLVLFDTLFVVGGITASLLIRYGNEVGSGLFALVAVLIALGELTRRAEAVTTEHVSFKLKQHLGSFGCLFLAAIIVAPEMGNRLVAAGSFYIKANSSNFHALPCAPASLASIVVPQGNGPGPFDLEKENLPFADALTRFRAINAQNYMLPTRDYMRSIVEGVHLLETIDYRNRTVFTFDMVNPFTYALSMKPPTNDYPLFWVGGGFTSEASRLPSPKDLLGDADFIMVPRLPLTPAQLADMIRIYGPYLRQHYLIMKKSPHWELWVQMGLSQ